MSKEEAVFSTQNKKLQVQLAKQERAVLTGHNLPGQRKLLTLYKD